MFTSRLTKEERKLIKKIAKIQLASIESILKEDGCIDIELYCLQNELDKSQVREEANKSLDKFKELLNTPGNLLSLDDNNLSICKHIMFNYFDGDKYQNPRRSIWRKFLVKENFLGNLN